MNWLKLATLALGAGLIIAAVLLPTTATVLMPAGAYVIGVATHVEAINPTNKDP